MKIRVKHDFFDKQDNLRLHRKEEIMEVEESRGTRLISMKLAEKIVDSKKTAE